MIYELLMERYKETELFRYMVQQIKPDAAMLLNGTRIEQVVKLIERKLVNPTAINLIEELKKLPRRELES